MNVSQYEEAMAEKLAEAEMHVAIADEALKENRGSQQHMDALDAAIANHAQTFHWIKDERAAMK